MEACDRYLERDGTSHGLAPMVTPGPTPLIHVIQTMGIGRKAHPRQTEKKITKKSYQSITRTKSTQKIPHHRRSRQRLPHCRRLRSQPVSQLLRLRWRQWPPLRRWPFVPSLPTGAASPARGTGAEATCWPLLEFYCRDRSSSSKDLSAAAKPQYIQNTPRVRHQFSPSLSPIPELTSAVRRGHVERRTGHQRRVHVGTSSQENCRRGNAIFLHH